MQDQAETTRSDYTLTFFSERKHIIEGKEKLFSTSHVGLQRCNGSATLLYALFVLSKQGNLMQNLLRLRGTR